MLLPPGDYKLYVQPRETDYPDQWYGGATPTVVHDRRRHAPAWTSPWRWPRRPPRSPCRARSKADGTTGLDDAWVYAFDNDTSAYVTSTASALDGSYAMLLPPGDYRLYVQPRNRTYSDQWYGGTTPTVVTIAGADVPGVDITLATGPIGYWTMDETSGTVAHDTGALPDNDAATVNSPSFVPGRIGTKALSLNGTNQYASTVDETTLDITGPITIAAWIKPTGSACATQRVLQKGGATAGNGYELSLATTTSEPATTCKVFFRLNGSAPGQGQLDHRVPAQRQRVDAHRRNVGRHHVDDLRQWDRRGHTSPTPTRSSPTTIRS